MRVVAGDDRVRVASVEVVDVDETRHGGDVSLTAEYAVDRIRGVRQEHGHHRVEVPHRLDEGVQDGRQAFALFGRLEFEGLGPGDVGVRLAHQPHGLGQGGALPVVGDVVADRVESAPHRGEELLVDGLEAPGCGDLAEVLGDHGGCAVDEVAPAGDELRVVAPHELGPGEVGVRVLGPGDRDEVAQGVGLVAGEDVAHVDDHVLRGGELLPLHCEELGGDHLGRQVEGSQAARLSAVRALAVVGEQFGRPDLGVEDDVVLAHEVVGECVGVVPPSPPVLGASLPGGGAAARPFDGGREVADDGVEPHVQALVRLVLPAGDRDPPGDVAAHGPRAHVFEQVFGEGDDVGAPFAGRLDAVEPLPQGPGQRGDVEEVVVGDLEARRPPGDRGDRVDEVLRVELVPAGVALVAARAGRAADRAGPLDVAVGQGVAGDRVDGDALLLDDHVPVVAADVEHLLDHALVVDGGGPGEQVVGQAEGHEVLDDDPVVLVGELLGRLAGGFGRHEDGRAVFVRAGDHEHVLAAHPHVPGEDVGGDAESGDVPDVARAVGVGPRNC